MAFLYLRSWISIQSSMELFYEGILASPSLILVLFSPISLVQLKLDHWDRISMFERIPRHTMHHYIRSKCPWVDLWMTLVHDLDHTAIKKDSAQVRLVVTWKREAHYWKIPILMKDIVQKDNAIIDGSFYTWCLEIRICKYVTKKSLHIMVLLILKFPIATFVAYEY